MVRTVSNLPNAKEAEKPPQRTSLPLSQHFSSGSRDTESQHLNENILEGNQEAGTTIIYSTLLFTELTLVLAPGPSRKQPPKKNARLTWTERDILLLLSLYQELSKMKKYKLPTTKIALFQNVCSKLGFTK